MQGRKLISAGADGRVCVWSLDDNTLLFSIDAHNSAVTCLVSDDEHIYSGSESSVKMWDMNTGKFLSEVWTGIQGAWNLAIDDKIVASAVLRGGETVLEV